MKRTRLLVALLLCCCVWPVTPATAYERGTYQLNERAVVLMGQGEYLEALELLQQARSAQPYNKTIQRNLALGYLGAGQQLLERKEYDRAADLLERGKEYDDQEARLWVLRGLSLLRLHDYLAAEAELNEAWAMQGDQPLLLRLLGRLYYDTDRMHEAVEIWERALALDPENQQLAQLLNRARRELAVEREMAKEYGGHFVISFDGQARSSLGNQVLEVLEEAYNWVGYRLEYYPQRQVPVIVYANRDFASLTGSPDWAAGLYDGKIRLPGGGVTEVGARMRALLFHEYMHVVVRDLAGGKVPFWLNEGLAELAARQQQDPPLTHLQQARREGTLLDFGRLEQTFRGLERSQVALAYEQGYDFVRFLIEEFGWFQMRDLLLALGKGATLVQAIDQSLGLYAVDYPTLQQRWREEQGR